MAYTYNMNSNEASSCEDDVSNSMMSHTFLSSPSQNSSSASGSYFNTSRKVPEAVHSEKDKYTIPGTKPYLMMIEQPCDKFRFRYKSEMSGTHGCILGADSKPRHKTFPTVELKNYEGEASICCTLVQVDPPYRYHSHQLVVRHGQDEIEDPHAVEVGPRVGFRVGFMGMSIIQTSKKHIAEMLLQKYNRTHGHVNEEELKKKCKVEAQRMNLNSVKLMFVAYDSAHNPICEKLYSAPIDNMKSAETCALRIVRMDKVSGSCQGGEEIFLLVEKVSRKNIAVRFYENHNEDRVWEALADFKESDVHHQYAIVVKTPPYKSIFIDKDVQVFIELFRPKDDAVSEPRIFNYKAMGRHHKRRREAEICQSRLSSNEHIRNLSGELPSEELPASVLAMAKADTNSFLETLYSFGSIEFNQNMMEFSTSNSRLPSLDQIQKSELIGGDLEDFHKFLIQYKENLTDKDFIVTDAPKPSNKVDRKEEAAESKKTAEVCESQKEKMEVENGTVLELKREDCAEPLPQTADPDNGTDDQLYPTEDTDKAIKAIQLIQACLKSPLQASAVSNIILRLLIIEVSRGERLLHLFVALKQTNVLKLLLNLISKYKLQDVLNSTNDKNETILYKAVLFFHNEYVPWMLLAGCNPNIADEDNTTPLQLAIMEDNMECVRHFLNKENYKSKHAHPIQLNSLNRDSLTALQLAVRLGSLPAVVALLEAGAESHVRHTNGCTLLHLAVENGHSRVLDYLLQNTKIPINAVTESAYTVLHMACVLDSPDVLHICENLLKHGADSTINVRNMETIHLAVKNKNPKVSEIIMEDLRKMDDMETMEDDVSVGDLVIKEEPFLDYDIFEVVCGLLDKSGSWRQILEICDIKELISICEDSDSPTQVMINNLEISNQISTQTFLELLLKFNENEAAGLVKQMLEKNKQLNV